MSPTLAEGAIALLLVWIAWRIGCLLAPWMFRRWRDSHPPVKPPPDRKGKPPYIIDN